MIIFYKQESSPVLDLKLDIQSNPKLDCDTPCVSTCFTKELKFKKKCCQKFKKKGVNCKRCPQILATLN